MFAAESVKKEIMRVTDLAVHQDGITLMENVSFSVFQGEIISICGFHNSGKNILSRVLSGDMKYDGGEIRYFLDDAGSRPPIVRINDISMLVKGRTIAENLFACYHQRGKFIYHEKTANALTNALLKQVGIQADATDLVDSLPRAKQHLLLIIKALEHGSRILILENISFSYNAMEYNALLSVMRRYENAAFIYIINRQDPIVWQSQRVICFRREKMSSILFQNSFDHDTLNRMLQVSDRRLHLEQKKKGPADEKVLELVPARGRGTAISVHRHEIVGILDLYGNIWFDLRKTFFQSADYAVYFMGRRIQSMDELLQKGLRISSGDTSEMLFPNMTIFENLTIGIAKRCSRFSVLNERMLKYAYKQVLLTAGEDSSHRMQSLMRNVILPPPVLIAENIMLGLESGAKQRIARQINETAKKGTGVLYISTSSEECFALCDRILIFQNETTYHWETPG